MDKDPKPPPFRFLSKEEYAELTFARQVDYVRDAVEAIKRGDPLDDLPVGETRSADFGQPKG